MKKVSKITQVSKNAFKNLPLHFKKINLEIQKEEVC